MLSKILQFLGIVKNREGELYTNKEDNQIWFKSSDMTYVELAKKMGRKAKSIRQRKYYLSNKK